MAVLRLFAGVKEVAGVEQIEVDVSTVGGLVAEADGRFGSDFVRARSGAKLWLNGEDEITDLATPIGRKDEVAIIPPVAGGTEAPAQEAVEPKRKTSAKASSSTAKSATATRSTSSSSKAKPAATSSKGRAAKR